LLSNHQVGEPSARLSSLMVPLTEFANLTGGWIWRIQQEGDSLSRAVIESERRLYHPTLLDALSAPAVMAYKDIRLFEEFCQDYFYYTVLDVANSYQLPLEVDNAELSSRLAQCSRHLSTFFANPQQCTVIQNSLSQAANVYLETPFKSVPAVEMQYRQ
jgi:hypothetical protein